MAGRALAGFDRIAQWAEIEAADEGVHQTGLMIRRQHGVERARRQNQLIAHRPAQPGRTADGRRGRHMFWQFVEKLWHHRPWIDSLNA
jgi:hypothetical protein